MPTKDELVTTYPELLSVASDASQRRLIADLHAVYSAPEPPAALLEAVRRAARAAATAGVAARPERLRLRRRSRAPVQ